MSSEGVSRPASFERIRARSEQERGLFCSGTAAPRAELWRREPAAARGATREAYLRPPRIAPVSQGHCASGPKLSFGSDQRMPVSKPLFVHRVWTNRVLS